MASRDRPPTDGQLVAVVSDLPSSEELRPERPPVPDRGHGSSLTRAVMGFATSLPRTSSRSRYSSAW